MSPESRELCDGQGELRGLDRCLIDEMFALPVQGWVFGSQKLLNS